MNENRQKSAQDWFDEIERAKEALADKINRSNEQRRKFYDSQNRLSCPDRKPEPLV